MPELPEVQTIVNDLNTLGVVGRTIKAAAVYWPKTVAPIHPETFCTAVKGTTIERIFRRAKYIVIALSGGLHLIVHLRMTGRFVLSERNDRDTRHVHARLTLDDLRQLDFHDTRKFGRFYLVSNPDLILNTLGPEPLSDAFSGAAFRKMLKARKRQIKPLLLDQHFLAGLGNIYVDEALWSARLHPLRIADQLTPREIRGLHRSIRGVLRKGIENSGTSLGKGKNNFFSVQSRKGTNGTQLQVFRRTGQACRRCGGPIVRIVVGQRSTHICTHCQPP